jgi:FkbM family methyltransferase
VKAKIAVTKKKIFGHELSLAGYQSDGYYREIANDERVYDEDLLILLKTALDNIETDSALDIGANIGYISCFMAKQYPNITLHAFEPVLGNVKVLEKNIKLNNLNNVIVHAFGLGRKKQTILAAWDPDNRGSAFITKPGEKHNRYIEHDKVSVRVLDDEISELDLKKCKLIKLDIEGYEPEFIKGSRQFISQQKPIVVMEINVWCLDALQRVNLPSFLDELLAIFPHVHGFWSGHVIDVRENKELYMHENIVNQRFLNIICSFDKAKHAEILKRYQLSAKHLDDEDFHVKIDRLDKDNLKLKHQVETQASRLRDKEQEIAFLHRQQRDVYFLAKQLAKETQLRLNKRAGGVAAADHLHYEDSQALRRAAANPKANKTKLLNEVHSLDKRSIKRRRSGLSSKTKPLMWKAAAGTMNTTIKLAKKVKHGR